MVMRMISLLCNIDIIDFAVSMTVAVTTMSVRVIMEQRQTNDVGQQAQTADDADKFGVLDLLRLHQSLYGLQEDRQTQGDQKYSVDQGT